MMQNPVHYGASLLMIALLMGAGGCKTGEESASTGSDVPSDLEIVFGQQGTFAGRGMGYSINAAGEVVRWEGKYPGELKEARAAIDPKHVRRLWHRAEEIEFLSMQDQTMATLHSFISVSAGGESRRVTWAERAEGSPTPAQDFFDECMETARMALGENR